MVPQPSSSPVCVSDTSLAASTERAWDRMMAWVALYIPTYGTSVVLHVAVGLLLAFMIISEPARQEEYRYDTFIDRDTRPLKVERRVKHRPETRGRHKPQDDNYFKRSLLKIRGIGEDRLYKNIPVLGIGPNRRGGGPEGWGEVFGPSPTIFPPVEQTSGKVVYVVDRSGSMTDSIDFVKAELRRSIMELGDDVEFHVIFYSSGPPVEMPTRRLVAATDRNKQLAFEFVDGIIPQGETDPSKALERAFAVRPETIYLLTDGEFDRGIIGLVKRLNAGRRARVLTIGFLYTYPGTTAETVLKQIAQDSGGEYKFVSEQDLASILAGV